MSKKTRTKITSSPLKVMNVFTTTTPAESVMRTSLKASMTVGTDNKVRSVVEIDVRISALLLPGDESAEAVRLVRDELDSWLSSLG